MSDDKKVIQLVKGGDKTAMTPEFRASLDEMYSEIQAGGDFVLVMGDKDGNGVSFLTTLNHPSMNLLLDQVKFGMMLG